MALMYNSHIKNSVRESVCFTGVTAMFHIKHTLSFPRSELITAFFHPNTTVC